MAARKKSQVRTTAAKAATSARKSAAKKSTAKKSTAKKSAAKATTAKKTASRKAAATNTVAVPTKGATPSAMKPVKPEPSARLQAEARARPAALVCAEADLDFALGRWARAAAGYAAVVVACPLALRPRLRVGDALLNLGHRQEALDVYRAVTSLAVRRGAPLIALVAQKIASLLDPTADNAGLIAEQFARGAPRVDALMPITVNQAVGNEAATPFVNDERLAARVAAVGATLPANKRGPPNVAPVPLLSYLNEDDFTVAIDCLRLRRFSAGESIIRQGERSESVFIIADGEVNIVRASGGDDDVTLARLRGGAVFGELALISDEPRAASAVAVGDVDLLELRRSELIVAAAHTPGLSSALQKFTRERFLRNLTATHPFFAPLGRDDRHRVMDQTRVLTFSSGDTMIQEGQRGPGLFVLLGGAASVKKALPLKPGEPLEHIHLATLRGGDLCGEMSMLTDAATNATVTCTTDLEALFLSRDSFTAVTSEHPELLRFLAGLTDERLRKNRALLLGRGLLEDDEHVMI